MKGTKMPTVYFSEGKWNKQGIGEKIYIPEVTEPLLDCFNGEQFKSLAFKMFMTKSVEKPVALELPEGVVADAPTKKKYDKRGALFRMNQYCNLLADLKVRDGLQRLHCFVFEACNRGRVYRRATICQGQLDALSNHVHPEGLGKIRPSLEASSIKVLGLGEIYFI
jgi:hypothetical protein